MAEEQDTIAAPVTAPGQAGVAIVRLSGPKTRELIRQSFNRAERVFSSPRSAVLGTILDGAGAPLDNGLCLFFPKPQSYTGEDVAELHLHGSPFLVRSLLAALVARGARQAEPGEFTKRAYLNGCIDLTQAEAVADLIAAETEVQARVAREQLTGRLSGAVDELGEPLRNLLAEVEAHIDFPEEGITPLAYARWADAVETVLRELRRYIDSFATGRIFREGALVVLAGLPNAGKSSLLNRLLGEERAIVTAVPGTTRDSIEERASLDGLSVRFCDTAGLFDASAPRILDTVEQLGVERSWQRLEHADLVLFLLDAERELGHADAVLEAVRARNSRVLVVANKVDLVDEQKKQGLRDLLQGREPGDGVEAVLVSASTGEGLDALRRRLVSILVDDRHRTGSLLVTTQRHADALKEAAKILEDAALELRNGLPAELVSVHLRGALRALEEIVGVTPTEDILGRIFSKFCIGK